MNKSKVKRVKRVRRVYPVWVVISFILVLLMILLEYKLPTAIFLLVVFFLLKDLIFDLDIVKISLPELYWAEHAPFVLFIFIIGTLSVFGMHYFHGYVDYKTTIISGIDFIIDFSDDLMRDT